MYHLLLPFHVIHWYVSWFPCGADQLTGGSFRLHVSEYPSKYTIPPSAPVPTLPFCKPPMILALHRILLRLVAIHDPFLHPFNSQSLGVYRIIEQVLEIILQLMLPIFFLEGLRY